MSRRFVPTCNIRGCGHATSHFTLPCTVSWGAQGHRMTPDQILRLKGTLAYSGAAWAGRYARCQYILANWVLCHVGIDMTWSLVIAQQW